MKALCIFLILVVSLAAMASEESGLVLLHTEADGLMVGFRLVQEFGPWRPTLAVGYGLNNARLRYELSVDHTGAMHFRLPL